jgi:hypothetical protein
MMRGVSAGDSQHAQRGRHGGENSEFHGRSL